MALIVGMDEAGYGPNLGPLVVTAVAWEVPGDPRKADLWCEFDGIVSPEPTSDGAWVQIADSKQVYSPARGLMALEAGVLAALGLLQQRRIDGRQQAEVVRTDVAQIQRSAVSSEYSVRGMRYAATGTRRRKGGSNSVNESALRPADSVRVEQKSAPGAAVLAATESDSARALLPESLEHMRRWLSPAGCSGDDCPEPWHHEVDLPLPHTGCCRLALSRLQRAWHERCLGRGIQLRGICCDVVRPARFNTETRRHDSKGRALSEISMKVLASLLGDVAGDEPALIVADKHGGRNRYHEFLPLAFGERFIRCREEGMERSRYQVGSAEIRFETKAERHLPVALASMVSKYVRELSMVLFNRYWAAKLPGLKPTAGYPNDAVRFRAEIVDMQRELGIADDVLWRER